MGNSGLIQKNFLVSSLFQRQFMNVYIITMYLLFIVYEEIKYMPNNSTMNKRGLNEIILL